MIHLSISIDQIHDRPTCLTKFKSWFELKETFRFSNELYQICLFEVKSSNNIPSYVETRKNFVLSNCITKVQ